MYCNNCGKQGHKLDKCDLPITSCGLVCFSKVGLNTRYLMIRRRHSFAYFDFLMAKYEIMNIKYLQELFNNMTIYEREKIRNSQFNYLWNNLWSIKKTGTISKKNRSGFYKGIIKFNILKNGISLIGSNELYNINYFIDKCTKNYRYPEWNFPKGRREDCESDYDCAQREFQEETNFHHRDFIIHEKIRFNNLHTGNNGKIYKTVLFGAEYTKTPNTRFNMRNKFQKEEIGDMKWMSKNEIVGVFRDYEHEKKESFLNIDKKISSFK